MTPKPVADVDRAKFDHLVEVRTAALEHFLRARDLSRERKALIEDLMGAGYSQADIARELGVTRQAVRKMLTKG